MLQQTHYTQDTGIGSFAESSPDYELAPVGLGSFQDQTRKLAEFGRNGDIYVVHAAEGETVIPMEVLNANPKVRELLFGQMREMGLDPQEFVVGNELNSINPVTGFPEFFFSSVFRAVKKAVKKVVKVVKKIAPIVLPIAASAFGVPFLGPAFGAGTFGAAFLGSGIGTLVGGGSIKDSIKSGLFAGGTSLAFSGIGSLFKGGNFQDALTANLTGRTPVYDAAGKVMGHKYAASPWAIGSSDAAKASAAASTAQWDQILGGPKFSGAEPVKGSFRETMFGPAPTATTPGFVPVSGTGTGKPINLLPWDVGGGGGGVTKVGQTAVTAGQQAQVDAAVNSAMKAAKGEGSLLSLSNNPLLGGPTISVADVLKVDPTLADLPALTLETAVSNINPGPVAKYGPTVALGLGATALAGGFNAVEGEQPEETDLAGFTDFGPSGAELVAQNPQDFLIAGLDPVTTPQGTPLIPTTFPAVQQAARGGMAEFPRRDLLVEGSGTERSDDIPAMLSDGEFVINAKAVRGADPTGRGNRYAGARNLYNMMRNFEMKA